MRTDESSKSTYAAISPLYAHRTAKIDGAENEYQEEPLSVHRDAYKQIFDYLAG